MLTSLYIDGNTLLHRLSAGAKLSTLFVGGLGLYFTESLTVQLTGLILAVLAYASVGISLREGFRRVAPALFTIFVLFVVNAWLTSLEEATVMCIRLSAIVTFAAAVTASMTMSDFIEMMTWAMTPLERLKLVNAADLSLALGLVLRFVPEVFADYQAIRDAHRARGLPMRWHTIIGPLMVLTLKNADTVSEAIDARGIRQQVSPEGE